MFNDEQFIQHSTTRIQHSWRLVGLGRFELPTSRLSGVRSNQLSYRPVLFAACRSEATDLPATFAAATSIIREPGEPVP